MTLPTRLPLDDYQESAARWLQQHRKAILADDIGLGKTATAIGAAELVNQSPVCVVCPKSVIPQWQAEIMRFSDRPDRYYVTNYERAADLPDPRILIVDEATYIKNPEAQRTVTVMEKAMQADYAFFLTATPVRNNQADVFVPFFAIFPSLRTAHTGDLATDLRRSYRNFIRSFFFVDWNPQTGQAIVRNLIKSKRPQYEAMCNHAILRREKKDYLNLPELRQELTSVPWGRGQEEAYQAILTDAVSIPDDKRHHGNILAAMMRLRQVCTDPGLCDLDAESGKAVWLNEFFATQPQPTIVFSYFVDFLEAMHVSVERSSLLHGGMSSHQREAHKSAFLDGKTDVFFVNYEAGGVGLNLQRAVNVVWVDLPWTPDTWEQGTGRSYRRGQENEVTEIVLGHPSSIDGKILRTLRRKRRYAKDTYAMLNLWKQLKLEV